MDLKSLSALLLCLALNACATTGPTNGAAGSGSPANMQAPIAMPPGVPAG
ncbi:MAG: hypothetical protein ACOY5C_04600 [Pseudomonadota bacterium]